MNDENKGLDDLVAQESVRREASDATTGDRGITSAISKEWVLQMEHRR